MPSAVIPTDLMIYKMVKEYEQNNKIKFTRSELLTFSHYALEIAGEMDNQKYFIVSLNKLGPDFHREMSPICNLDIDYFILDEDKYMNGGKEYAYGIIDSMSDSFLKAATIRFNEEMQNSREALSCD